MLEPNGIYSFWCRKTHNHVELARESAKTEDICKSAEKPSLFLPIDTAFPSGLPHSGSCRSRWALSSSQRGSGGGTTWRSWWPVLETQHSQAELVGRSFWGWAKTWCCSAPVGRRASTGVGTCSEAWGCLAQPASSVASCLGSQGQRANSSQRRRRSCRHFLSSQPR